MSTRDDKFKNINDIVNNDVMGYLGGIEQTDTTPSETPKKPQNEVNNSNLKANNDTIDRNTQENQKNYKKKSISTDKQGKVRTDKEGNIIYTKQDNSSITFKIDANIESYLDNIETITFIESIKKGNPTSTNKTKYLNQLIRQDLLKLLGLKPNTSDEVLNTKWLEYKKANNIK